MTFGLGLGLGLTKQRVFSSGGGRSVSGLRITLTPNPTWLAVFAIAVVDNGGINIMQTTRIAYANANNFSSIVAGQYTSTSTYNQNPIHTWSTSNTVHWNEMSQVMNIYLEFPSPVLLSTIASVQVSSASTVTYGMFGLTLEDELGAAIAIGTAPTGASDKNGDATINGVTTTNTFRYKWSGLT